LKSSFLNAKRGGQSARWAVAPVELALTPTRKATPFAVVKSNSLSANANATFQRKVAHLMIAYEILPII
jgi:hypothetical protein